MLTPIADDLWQLTGESMRMPGGFHMPLSATIVRLPDRTLVIYSPTAIAPDDANAIDALGDVAHLVAPNLLHHLHVDAAAKRWPRAILHAPSGLAAKRGDLAIHKTLGEPEPAWRDAIEHVEIAGAPKLSETVMLHRSSRTLICADFLFNVTQPKNLRTRMVLAMMGVGGKRLAQSRAWKFFVRDRAAARESIDRILGWPIARIAPTHGDVIAIDAHALAPLVTRSYGGRATTALPSPA